MLIKFEVNFLFSLAVFQRKKFIINPRSFYKCIICFFPSFLSKTPNEKIDKTQFATNIRFDMTRSDNIEACAIGASSRSPLRKERKFFQHFPDSG